MKIILSTAAVCLAVGASVFTTQKVIETEARKTRNSMPGMLNNPIEGGESLVAKVDNLNASLAAVNRRLTRLEEISGRESKESSAEIMKVTVGIREELDRVAQRINTIAGEQAALQDIARQMNLLNAGMRTLAGAIDTPAQTSAAPSDEVINALDWMVQKIEDIDSYFPPLYDFLGAVYAGDGTSLADYPSVDLRLNEMLLTLDKVREDAAETRRLVTPYIIEPTKRPRPFENN